MKGNNKLILNEATMIEAVQCWLNKLMLSPPRVSGVRETKEHNGHSFEVQISEQEAARGGQGDDQ